MGRRLNIRILFLTFLAGGAGMSAWYLLFVEGDILAQTRFLAEGLFFVVSLVMGMLGLLLAEYWQRKKFRVIRPWKSLFSLILAAALGMAVGAGGQALYSLSWQNGAAKEADIILLLDGSDSMHENWDLCRETACKFIDRTKKSSRIQAVSFGSIVLDATELTAMDKAGKKEVKDFIRQMDIVGGTDFESALEWAAQQLLDAENREGRRQAVVMVTDGQAEVGSQVQEIYKQGNLLFYPIQLHCSDGSAARMDGLTALAEAAGGFDTRLEPDKAGKISARKIKTAFDKIYADVREITQSDVWLGFGAITENIAWCFGIRLVSFVLFAVLAGFVYYQRQTKLQILANAAAGCVTACLVTAAGALAGNASAWAAMFLIDFFLVSAWNLCSAGAGDKAAQGKEGDYV